MNILLADDHPLFADSLHSALEEIFPSCTIQATKNWLEVTTYTQNHFFDLILLDLVMPGADRHQWELHLTKIMENPQGAICIISGLTHQDQVQQAFRLGVNGYIYKTFTLEKIQSVLRRIYAGEHYFPPSLTWTTDKDDQEKILTRRQREVLKLLSGGYSNKEIAACLFLSESTVKRHTSNLYRALKAKSRADAVRIARQRKLLS